MAVIRSVDRFDSAEVRLCKVLGRMLISVLPTEEKKQLAAEFNKIVLGVDLDKIHATFGLAGEITVVDNITRLTFIVPKKYTPGLIKEQTDNTDADRTISFIIKSYDVGLVKTE